MINTIGYGQRTRVNLLIERRLCVELLHDVELYTIRTNFPEINADDVIVYSSTDYADAYEKWWGPLLDIKLQPVKPWIIRLPNGEEYGDFDSYEDAVHFAKAHDYQVRWIKKENPPKYVEEGKMGNYATDEF